MDSRAPHVLWLSRETPDQSGQGGQRRQYFQIVELLRAGARVTLATTRSSQSTDGVPSLAHYVELHYSRMLRRLHPDPVALASACRADQIVVGHAESLELLHGQHNRLPVPWLVDFHNVNSRWYGRHGELGKERYWLGAESVILSSASASLVCSADERDALVAQQPEAKVMVAPNGIDRDEWPMLERRQPERPSVALFGSWWYPPNREGAVWFCTEVWPRIVRDVPDAELHVAGRAEPPPEVAASPGVRLIGAVDDLAEFFAGVTAVAVPVLAGPGTPLKFGEALASGAPVIATADAAAGAPDAPAVISNAPDQLAQGTVELLRNSSVAADMGTRGRDFAFERLSWEHTQTPLVDWVWGH